MPTTSAARTRRGLSAVCGLALGSAVLLTGCLAPRHSPDTTPDSRTAVEVADSGQTEGSSRIEYELQPPARQDAEAGADLTIEEIEVVDLSGPDIRELEPQPTAETLPLRPPVVEPKFDIPIVENDRVKFWIGRYSGSQKHSFEAGMKRSGRYLEMARRIFAEEGVPKDMAYMARRKENRF